MFWSSLIALALSSIMLMSSPGRQLLVTQSLVRLLMAMAISAVGRGILTLIVPRRPNVYRGGKMVDREDSACMLSRYSFAWGDSVLKYIAENRSLGVEELPELAFWQRSENLSWYLEKARASHKTLFRALIYAHGRSLALQGLLTLISSALSIGPQLAVYAILRSLEATGPEPWTFLSSWQLVSALGLSMILAAGVEARVMWLMYSRVCFPITAELTSIIFQKMMRRKDLRYFPPTGKNQETASGIKGGKSEDDKTTQNIINLVAIDGGRITTFISYTYLMPASALKLLVSCGFLLNLIGWKSLISGFLVSFLLVPFKSYCTKQYAQAQKNLMRSRDEKLAIVTEALQGIRQIKISAEEEQWQRRLSDYRAVELHALRAASLFNAGLFSLTTLDPLLLSAVSLPVYALTYGTLQPSVAFTAMSLFASLELSLGILPDFFAKWFEASISSGRINQFLKEPEKEEITLPGTSIIFDNAAISWPKGTTYNGVEAFVLRGLQLEFPMGKLSVISGNTGSGKSLLLQAILGECDLLEGTIYVPSCSSYSSSPTSSEDWVIPSTIAYVAQIPWIENATMKENILFGLPYHYNRYRTVLYACALMPDFAMFDSGDLAEVGVNGINLSGGQRCRLSLARALYSRAENLIIDDIFSALDTQTSSHVYRHALTGSISQGRTRILVTHHIDLCLPGTDYFVYLENMTVKYAGASMGFLRTLRGAQSPRTLNGAETDTNEQVDNQMSPPVPNTKTQMRFVRDEERATGSTKFRFYKSYFARGGLLLWVLAVILYASYTTLMFGRVSLSHVIGDVFASNLYFVSRGGLKHGPTRQAKGLLVTKRTHAILPGKQFWPLTETRFYSTSEHTFFYLP
jgi:ABC-type multidrug transport system fused ATPase/permease subunit